MVWGVHLVVWEYLVENIESLIVCPAPRGNAQCLVKIRSLGDQGIHIFDVRWVVLKPLPLKPFLFELHYHSHDQASPLMNFGGESSSPIESNDSAVVGGAWSHGPWQSWYYTNVIRLTVVQAWQMACKWQPVTLLVLNCPRCFPTP